MGARVGPEGVLKWFCRQAFREEEEPAGESCCAGSKRAWLFSKTRGLASGELSKKPRRSLPGERVEAVAGEAAKASPKNKEWPQTVEPEERRDLEAFREDCPAGVLQLAGSLRGERMQGVKKLSDAAACMVW